MMSPERRRRKSDGSQEDGKTWKEEGRMDESREREQREYLSLPLCSSCVISFPFLPSFQKANKKSRGAAVQQERERQARKNHYQLPHLFPCNRHSVDAVQSSHATREPRCRWCLSRLFHSASWNAHPPFRSQVYRRHLNVSLSLPVIVS